MSSVRFTHYCWCIFFFLFAQGIWSSSAFAATPTALPVSIDTLTLKRGDTTLNNITSVRASPAFVPLTDPLNDIVVPGLSDTWLRIRLTQDWPHALPPVLTIAAESMAQRLVLYQAPDFEAREYNLFDREVAAGFSREGIFIPLNANLKTGDEIYAQISGVTTGRRISLKLDEYTAMAAYDNRNVRWTTIILSIFFTVAIGTFFCWLFFPERILLLYVGQVIGQFLYVLYLRGDGLTFYYPRSDAFAMALVGGLPVAIYGFFATLFMREFIDLKKYSLWADRTSLMFAGLILLCGLAHALSPIAWHWTIMDIGNLIYLLWTPLMLGITVWIARKGNKSAWFLLASWGPSLFIGVYVLWDILFRAKSGPIGLLAYPIALAFASITLVLGVAHRMLQHRRELDIARVQAQYDGLTGVLNRRTAMERLRDAHQSSAKSKKPLSVLFVDLDHFKAVNDTYTHAAGDACLKTVVRTLQNNLRHTDHIGRFGGEEFLVVLPDTDTDTAMHLAERMRQQIAELQVPYDGKIISITTSIGVTNGLPEASSPEDLVNLADKALYQAKNDGRNVVRLLTVTNHSLPLVA